MDQSHTVSSAKDSDIATNFTENLENMGNSALKSTLYDGQTDEAATNFKENLNSDNSNTTFIAQDDQIDDKETSKTIPKLDGVIKNEQETKTEINKGPGKGPKECNKPSLLPTARKYIPSMAATSSTTSTTSAGKSKMSSIKPGPNTSTSLNNKNVSRTTSQQQKSQPPRSNSKVRENKPDFGFGSKVESSSTKSKSTKVEKSVTKSFLTKAKDETKSLTARSQDLASTQKRSASNASTLSTSRLKKKEIETNLRKMTSTAGDHSEIDTLEKKLEDVQTEFLHKIENLNLTSPGKLKSEYKFIIVIRNDKCKLMVKDDELSKLPLKFPPHSVKDFEEKLRKYMAQCFATLLGNLKDSEETPNISLETAHEKMEHLEILQSNDILSFIDDLYRTGQEDVCDTEIIEMRKELQESNKSLQESNKSLKKSEKKLNDVTKQHKEEVLNLEKELKSKADEDLAQKDLEIKDLQKKLKAKEKQNDNLKSTLTNLQEELKKSRDSNDTIKQQLFTMEQQLNKENIDMNGKNERIKKLENDVELIQILKSQLEKKTKQMEELQATTKATNNCTKHLQQISELQNQVNSFENEKLAKESKIEELKAEVQDIIEVRAKLQESENCVQDLQKQLKANEKSLDYSKDMQMEIAKFRQSEAEKRREIEKLKVVLSKFEFNKCQLEEQIQRDNQLLEVRSELINSLQTNEKSQRTHMEELFSQVGEKNNTINELNSELRTKSEEFRNLFTTISTKQMELSNQEHIIKLLEESNERSQMLRVKQEEKIARMEEELAHLKQTIAIYQGNILSTNNGKNLLYPSILPPSNLDYSENFYYYTSQRKRKRQVDINVKKYEA